MKKFWIKNRKKISLLLYLLGLTLVALFFIKSDPDYWWHVKVGENIVNSGRVLMNDIYSWYGIINNYSWYAHEWLSEVIIYLFKVIFKDYGVLAYIISSYFSLNILLFLCNKKSYLKNIHFTLVWTFIGVLMIGMFISGRPHMLSYLLLTITLYLLFDYYYHDNSKKIYFLPLVSLLWVNLHAGSSNLPYILCFIFFYIGLINIKLGTIVNEKMPKKKSITYLVIGLLCVLVLFINPKGGAMLIYPYSNMRDYMMLTTIVEWLPVNISKITGVVIYGIIGFMLLLIIKYHSKHSFLKLFLLACFTYLALKSIRFVPLLYIVSTFIIFDYVKEIKDDCRSDYALIISGIVFVLFVLPKFNYLKDLSIKGIVDDSFITLIKEEKPKRLYNYYDYGGYLINKDILVFVDGRYDLYANNIYHDSYNLLKLKGPYEEIINKYDFDYFLLDSSTQLTQWLRYNRNYEILLENNSTILFKNKN